MDAAVDVLWLQEAPLSGFAITRYDHVPPAYRVRPGRIELVEASHSVPEEAASTPAARIVALTRGLTADDLVLGLVPGRSLTLLSTPAPGLPLEGKQSINQVLLCCRAAVDKINCVRKHLLSTKKD